MKRIAVQVSLAVLLLCAGAVAQKHNAARPDFSKPYWLNHSLIFFEGCQPVVSAHNIIFTKGSCDGISAYSGKIFLKAAKVKIYSVNRGKGFTRVRLRHWPEIYELDAEYEILLKSDTKKNFSQLFRLLFSDREPAEDHHAMCPVDLLTKAQVIRCMGFPITVSRRGGVEKYSYILEFVGFGYFGYDGWTFKIKHNKVISLSGYI